MLETCFINVGFRVETALFSRSALGVIDYGLHSLLLQNSAQHEKYTLHQLKWKLYHTRFSPNNLLFRDFLLANGQQQMHKYFNDRSDGTAVPLKE
jgi:hypothetical protein